MQITVSQVSLLKVLNIKIMIGLLSTFREKHLPIWQKTNTLNLSCKNWFIIFATAPFVFSYCFVDFNLHLLMRKYILLLLLISAGLFQQARAQQTITPATKTTAEKKEASISMPVAPLASDSILVTVILKHQQDKNLPEMKRILEAQGFWDLFPISDARVMSWTLAMGLGHVIILKLPPTAIRRLNLAIENGAWGAFDSEIYLSYDYKVIWEESQEKRLESREDRN
jgi:hypothetical protein